MEVFCIVDIDELIAEDIKCRQNKSIRERSLREYYQNPNLCKQCNQVIIIPKDRNVAEMRGQKFCNLQCALAYRKENIKPKALCSICGVRLGNKNTSGLCVKCHKQIQDDEKIKVWKETGSTGCGVSTTLRNCIRDYILNKQDGECAICHMPPIWNGMELRFILDHFDGDASNDSEDNLRLICPNCDSQLDTYKARNKESARNHRRISKMADELGGCSEPT